MNYLSGIIRHKGVYGALSALLVVWAMSLVAWLVDRDVEEGLEFPLAKTLASYASTLEGGTINSRAMGAAILFGQENLAAKQLALGRLPPDAPGVRSALDMIRTSYTAETVLLANKRGTVMAYSNGVDIPGSGRDLSFRPYVQLALQGTPNVYPAVGVINPTRGIFLSAPLRAATDNTSRPIGAVVIKIGAGKLDGLLKSWTDGAAVLLSPQGVVFAASRDDWLLRTTGKMSAGKLAEIRRTRQFGTVFDQPPLAPLPFSPDASEARIADVSYAVRSLPLEWNDPEGDWTLTFLERRTPWWARGSVLGFGALAGLITGLGLLWFYQLARNTYLLDSMNSRLQHNELVLRESDAQLKESQSIAGLGTYTLDVASGVWQSSEVLDQIFGIGRAYVRSREGWYALVHPEDRALMISYLDDVLGRRQVFNKEFRIVTHDGQTVRWVHALGKLEFDAQRQPLRLHGTVQDISERKAAEEEIRSSMRKLEEKELAKTRFLAAAGHDLRQPLAAANLFIDALEVTSPTDDQNRIIQRLKQAMSTFNGLLDALLNISRLDAGVIKPERTAIDTAELGYWLAQNFAPLAAEKKIAFKLYLPSRERLILRSDIGLVKSVLMNLVSNAIKFTSRGGILVSIRRRGDDALFQVWDTGMGIAPQHLEQIFDEFYQVNNPQRDRTRGLGLGLSIAKRALTLLGGKISCRSLFGRGSVFEFRLPLEHASAAAPQRRADQTAAGAGAEPAFAAGKSFVVVEDDTLVAQALVNLLEGMGGKALCFHSAEDALRHSQVERADYYIVDYMLGGTLSGIQFLNQLQQRLDKPLNAVLMTGDTSPSFMREAADLHWSVLHKPVSASKLVASLAA